MNTEDKPQNQQNYINGLQQDLQQYEAGVIPPIAEPPQTFVIECNKTMSQEDGDSLRPNTWTNNFPPIKLKKGDVVSVNSAFLSTRGSGDLLQFDETNNKMRMIFEYYATNDNANNKKPSFNIKGFSVGDIKSAYTYNENATPQNCYPVNYRPMPLYRLMETFYSADDYTAPTPLPITLQFTEPTLEPPYFTEVKEAYWGYQQANDFIFSGVEDKYVGGLFRDPVVNLRETMICSMSSETPLDPTTEPYFGNNLPNLAIWYVSTQTSAYGKCSDNATMRIYFFFSRDGDENINAMTNDTFSLLRMLRVGQYIQFKDVDRVMGLASGPLMWNGGDRQGSNCFYVSGYNNLMEGLGGVGSGTPVDIYTQFGQRPIQNNPKWGTDEKYYNMSCKNPLGQILKVVKININNANSADKDGISPAYKWETADLTQDYYDSLPFIEVQAENAISVAFGNPNYAHANAIPSMGVGINAGLANSSPDPNNYYNFLSRTNQITLRTWYAGANKVLTRTPKLTSSMGGALTTKYRDQYGTASSKVYPFNDQNADAINEKMYVAFRPYYYSPTADKRLECSYCMPLIEDNMITGVSDNLADMTNNLGITSDSPSMVAHNYNFTTLNKDGTTSPLKVGGDILEEGHDTKGYCGGRTPQFWTKALPFQPSLYDKPIATATRIGVHNQGQSFYRDTTPNNITGAGGFFGKGIYYNDAEARTSLQQKDLNPITNIYIDNQLGRPTKFFFGGSIDNASVYDGRQIELWDKTENSFNANPNLSNGTHNFIVGASNLPLSMFQDGPPPANSIDSGIFYGYRGNAVVAGSEKQPINSGAGYKGIDLGVPDLRYPLNQMPNITYARFTNENGESEVMYIKILIHPVETINDITDTNALNNNQQTATTINPVLLFGADTKDQSASPPFYIIQRDCENTGKKSFKGINTNLDGSALPFSAFRYDNATNVAPYTNANPNGYAQIKNYFEILNEFSCVEHQIEMDNTIKDLMPLSVLDFKDNVEYQNNFGVGDSLGSLCGGDFYLCKYPNMPFEENDTGIRRVIDNQIRLISNNIKKGEPTRVNGISSYTKTGHSGKYSWVKHYDYIDLDISGEKVYFSPTDIQNLITEQLHQPADLYKSYDPAYGGGGRFEGGYWKNTAGNYPMNSLFRTIHGPSEVSQDNSNRWDNHTGNLFGSYHEGDFCFFADIQQEVIKNGINAYAMSGGALMGIEENLDPTLVDFGNYTPKSGKYPVFIPNQHFYLNTLPTTDRYTTLGYNYGEPVSNQQVLNFHNETELIAGTEYINKWYKYPITFGSMFIGTNNAQLNYNTDISRFEWKFLHQSKYSVFTADSNGATSGGDIIASIWTESNKGYDNWDRYGGINVVNWTAPAIELGVLKSRRQTTNPLYTTDAIGKAFMNKLGFSDNWMASNSGSTDYADVADYSYNKCYKPLGTTRSDYDVSQAKPYSQVNPLLQTAKFDIGGDLRKYYDPPTTDKEKVDYLEVDNSNNSIGGMVGYNDKELSARSGSTPQNLVPTNQSYGGAQPWGNQPPKGSTSYSATNPALKTIGADLGYGFVNTKGTPQSVRYQAGDGKGVLASVKVPTDLNLDDVKFFHYDIEVDSSSIKADELPKKTLIGYFLIMSNIIDKHEFIGSANGGGPLNCIGILSKNYENNDFYFSFQSPVEFYVKQDRTITSIKTEILTPSLEDPAGLDLNSSIIYTIVRQQSLPEPDVPPISVQQALDYAVMEQMSGMLGIDQGAVNPYSSAGQLGLGQGNAGGAGLNTLRQNLVNAVLHPSQNSASMIFATQSQISSTMSRMSIGARSRLLQEGLSADPNDPLLALAPPAPAQAQLEGLGITQPAVEERPYLSAEQLQIQELNLMKKADEDSGAGRASFGEGAEGDEGGLFGFLGQGGRVPLDPVVDDDDMKSLRSAMTKDRTMFEEQDDTPDAPLTPTQFLADAQKNTRLGATHALGALPMAEFFNRFMSVSSEETRNRYIQERDQFGFDIDNPNVWRQGLLKEWAGEDGKFDWGQSTYKRIGGTLNLEGRSKITSALGKYKGLTRLEGKEVRKTEIERTKGRDNRTEIPQPKFGQESMVKRVSRSYHKDNRTRQDEKHIAIDWRNSNPYDMRTWSKSRINDYKSNLHYGVPVSARTPDNRLSEKAYGRLNKEIDRRKSEGAGKMKVNTDGTYANQRAEAEVGAGYDPKNQHLRPHKSVHNRKFKLKFKSGGSKLAPVPEEKKVEAKKGTRVSFKVKAKSSEGGKAPPRRLNIIKPIEKQPSQEPPKAEPPKPK